ncbi:MAG: hypothetical protein ACLUVM_08615 [Blautia faecis]
MISSHRQVQKLLGIRHYRHIFDGTAVHEKQPEESPTPYAAMITKKMGLAGFQQNMRQNWSDWCEALNPWPSAFTFINGKTLKVWKSSVHEKKQAQRSTGNCDSRGQRRNPGSMRPGRYSCFHEVQLEGKNAWKRMRSFGDIS